MGLAESRRYDYASDMADHKLVGHARFAAIAAVISIPLLNRPSSADAPPAMLLSVEVVLSTQTPDVFVESYANVAIDSASAFGFSADKSEGFYIKTGLPPTDELDKPQGHRKPKHRLPIRLPHTITGYVNLDGFTLVRLNEYPEEPTASEAMAMIRSAGKVDICHDVFSARLHSDCTEPDGSKHPCDVDAFVTSARPACAIFDSSLIANIHPRRPDFIERTRSFSAQPLTDSAVSRLAGSKPVFTCTGYYKYSEWETAVTYVTFSTDVPRELLKVVCGLISASNGIPPEIESARKVLAARSDVIVLEESFGD